MNNEQQIDETGAATSGAEAHGEANAEASAPAPARSLEETLEAWFRRHFHGLGPRLSEDVYNVASAAKDDLLAILRAA